MANKNFTNKTSEQPLKGVALDAEFLDRRRQARIEVNKFDQADADNEADRSNFFNAVYDRAIMDAAQIPWADLAPKPQLSNWLKTHPGEGKSALDIASGLGDNAEAMSGVGYKTTAFDVSDKAIEWAKRRFPNSNVHFLSADLFDPPSHWRGAFDLVNECYTLQALPPAMLNKTTAAIACLVKPQGSLLIYTRLRADKTPANGPPWPLEESDALKFRQLGFELVDEERFIIQRGERNIPHQFAHWQKTG